MPFIEINGANIYYETFGRDWPYRAPVVLIHGSTITGQADWHAIAPLLATQYRVIVPDCRGHGRSSNPQQSYSFREMADDIAALIRALGYQRAHLIGHSNGGNVALVTLMEHPDMVQTCIPQAANAYVSPDLIEREPWALDPDRVARESPEWVREMIDLHGLTYGPDYWRTLLQWTLHEIITEPNYTPADLAQVTRPVFAIQGEHDAVNAPGRHAQFIAEHIPAAELWIAPGIAHNVHLDIPLDWLRRVFDFLARRGDEANDALYRLRQSRYTDARDTIFDVRCSSLLAREEPGVRLSGAVLTADQLQAALEVLPALPDEKPVRILLTDQAPWAVVNRIVADVRREPDSNIEQVTQLLLGEAVRVLDERGNWTLIRTEHDGYLGWCRSRALLPVTVKQMRASRKAANALVKASLTTAWDRPGKAAAITGTLPFGLAVSVVEERRGYSAVRLPDDRLWWVKSADLLPLADRPKPTAIGIAFTLDLIKQLIGVPYLWGGRSAYGYDCSGLTQAFWGFMGVTIPRDADQQFRAGKPVVGTPRPGDLLFFSGSSPLPNRRQKITHVAISLGEDDVIHANGGAWSVSYNSLNPDSSLFRSDLLDTFVGLRRIK